MKSREDLIKERGFSYCGTIMAESEKDAIAKYRKLHPENRWTPMAAFKHQTKE